MNKEITSRQRSDRQNRALHKFFEELADEMLARGIDVKMVIKAMQNTAIMPNKDNVKELIWKPFQYANFGTTSTTKLKSSQIDTIFNDIDTMFKKDFHVDDLFFPSIKVLMQKTSPQANEYEEMPQFNGTREQLNNLTIKPKRP